jgi:hypothetical protein
VKEINVNYFIDLINKGKISGLDDLKKAYRKIAMKTHPDIVKSDRYVKDFMQCKTYFEEAKLFLKENIKVEEEPIIINENFRLMFYQELEEIYYLEAAYFFKKEESVFKRIKLANVESLKYLKKWKPEFQDLYVSAGLEYEKIMKEKRKNDISNLRKPSLFINLRPVFFNIAKYHTTGLKFYQNQIKQNISPVLKRLEDENYYVVREYLLFLINDLKSGSALFD